MAATRREAGRMLAGRLARQRETTSGSGASLVGPDDLGRVRTGSSSLLGPSSLARLFALLLYGRHWIGSLRLIHSINIRHDFLVSCRLASALASYARAKTILCTRGTGAVLVSSDSNPEEVGFTSATWQDWKANRRR